MFRFLLPVGVFFIITHPLWAQVAVIDSTAIAKMSEQISTTEALLTTANDHLNAVENVTNNLSGNLQRAASLRTPLSQIRRNLNRLTRAIDEINGGELPNMNHTRYIRDWFYTIWDPTTPMNIQLIKREYKQRSKLAGLESSELILHHIDEDFATYELLINESDQNTDLKDAQDVTNKILLAIHKTQIEIKQLLALQMRIVAADNFKGVHQKTYQTSLKSRPQIIKEGALNGWGMEDIPCPDRLKKLGSC